MRQFFDAYRGEPKLSTLLRELHPEAAAVFKDAYFLEFLDLPADLSEADLHRSMLNNLGRFLTYPANDDIRVEELNLVGFPVGGSCCRFCNS